MDEQDQEWEEREWQMQQWLTLEREQWHCKNNATINRIQESNGD